MSSSPCESCGAETRRYPCSWCTYEPPMSDAIILGDARKLAEENEQLREALLEAADGWVLLFDGTKTCESCGATWRGAEKKHGKHCLRAKWLRVLSGTRDDGGSEP